MRALVLLLATAGACFGWPLFQDEPRAAMGLASVLALVLFGMLKHTGSRLLSLVCTFGIYAHAAGLACVVWFEGLSSKTMAVCDEGTGMPVTLVFGAGLLVVAAEFLQQQQKGARS
jgi:hypothetical protein